MDESAVHHRADSFILTLTPGSNSGSSDNQTCTSSGRGRKVEDLEKTHAGTGTTSELRGVLNLAVVGLCFLQPETILIYTISVREEALMNHIFSYCGYKYFLLCRRYFLAQKELDQDIQRVYFLTRGVIKLV